MIEVLLQPFAYAYMFNAMWVSALVGAVCAFLSAYLMLKGWSLIGDALSHSIVPGVAGAYMLGLPFALGAFAAGGLAAGAMLFLNQRSGLKEDTIIGLIFTSFFGLGLFMVSLSPTSVSVQTITLGNILAITPSDTLRSHSLTKTMHGRLDCARMCCGSFSLPCCLRPALPPCKRWVRFW